MENINTHPLNLDCIIKNHIKEIDYKLSDTNIEDAMYIGLIILNKLCDKSANIWCGYDLSEKPPILYNLRENELKELVGRAYLGVVHYLHTQSSSIPYDHILHLKYKVSLIIEEFPHYESLKKSKIEIEELLKMIYQIVGSTILRRLEERNMIKIKKTEKHENSPVYIKILDNAYKFMAKYEEHRITD